jgi:hypothetical protein
LALASGQVSACGCPLLFGWFIGTTPKSDSSAACMSGARLMAFPDRPVTASGATEVSRFSCMKFLSVRGVSDYAGPSFGSRNSAIAGVAFLCSNGVGVPEVDFRSSIPGPPMPLSTLHVPPRDGPRKTRGQDGIRFLLSCRTLSFPTSCRFIPAHWSAPCLMSLRRAPVGFADWTAATPITGAPAAYCFDIHTPRASRNWRLSAPEHHRYVRFLDWKVHYEAAKTNHDVGISAGSL